MKGSILQMKPLTHKKLQNFLKKLLKRGLTKLQNGVIISKLTRESDSAEP